MFFKAPAHKMWCWYSTPSFLPNDTIRPHECTYHLPSQFLPHSPGVLECQYCMAVGWGIVTLKLAFSATLDTVPSPPYRARYHSLSRLKDASSKAHPKHIQSCLLSEADQKGDFLKILGAVQPLFLFDLVFLSPSVGWRIEWWIRRLEFKSPPEHVNSLRARDGKTTP